MRQLVIVWLMCASMAQGAISLLWGEVGDDVVVTFSGSIVVPATLQYQNNKAYWHGYAADSLGVADNALRGFNVLDHDDSLGVDPTPRSSSGTQSFSNEDDSIGFQYFFSQMSGTLSHEFAVTDQYLYIDAFVEPGESFAPSGTLTFANITLAELFGATTPVEEYIFIRRGGTTLIQSEVAPVPEPSSGLLVALGCLILARRKRCSG